MHIQQKHRKGHINNITTNPMTKGPIKIINDVADESKVFKPLLMSVISPRIKVLPFSLNEAFIPAIYSSFLALAS